MFCYIAEIGHIRIWGSFCLQYIWEFALGSEALKVFNDVPGLFGYMSLALLISQFPFMKSVFTKVSNFSYEYFLIHILVFKTIYYIVKPQGLMIQIACGGISIALALMLAFGYNRIISLFVTSRNVSCRDKKVNL